MENVQLWTLKDTGKSRKARNQKRNVDGSTSQPRLGWEVSISTPTKENWAKKQVMNKSEVSIFTDASITNKGIGVGIYSGALAEIIQG